MHKCTAILRRLADQAAAPWTEPQAIVALGQQVEEAIDELPAGMEQAEELLTLAVHVLLGSFNGSIHAEAARPRLKAAFSACADRIEGKDIRLDGVLQTLRVLLDPSAAAASPAAPPAEPAPAADQDPPRIGVDDLAARLMGLGSDDREELDALRGHVVALAGCQSLPPACREHLAQTAGLLERVVSGPAGQADELMAQINHHVAAALTGGQGEASSVTFVQPPAPPPPVPQAPAAPAPAPASAGAAPAPSAEQYATVLPDETDSELLREFINESLDHISSAEAALLALETDPTDAEQINRVFRGFHTIKGTSGFLALDAIQKLAHLAENLLERARGGQIRITGGYADLALKSCDMLKGMIVALKGYQPGDRMAVPDHFMDLLDLLNNPEARGVGEQAEQETLRLGEILVGRGKAARSDVENVAVTRGKKQIGEALIDENIAPAAEVAKALRIQKQMKGAEAAADSAIRVSTERLDNLINMVGELVIAQSMVGQDPVVLAGQSPRLSRSVAHAGKIVRELQDLTMGLRMVPLRSTFQKMARLVRDVARKNNKIVQLVTEGEETEIDRNMVEYLNDPLVHMMRNAVDHGIESGEQRRAAGKNPSGTVTLKAYHSAGNVVIELADDGKGLQREKILAKAVQQGLIESSRELSDSEVYALIFRPGFSTADKITDVSGRGVGMDVVKRNMDAIRGRIEIASRPGQGSTFRLMLPLTMAIADAMVLRVGSHRYLLPTTSIEQSFRPAPGTVFTVVGRGEMVNLRGQMLPLFRLARLFGVANTVQDPYQALLIVIEGQGRRCALMIDELLAQQQVVIKTLGPMFAHVQGVSGGAILGDGRVGLILDASALVQLSQGRNDNVRQSA